MNRPRLGDHDPQNLQAGSFHAVVPKPTVIVTPEALAETVDYFLQHDAFAFDVETMGVDRNVPTQNQVVWLSLATEGRAVTIPFGHPNGDVLIRKATRKK